jgi:hypothetical protein
VVFFVVDFLGVVSSVVFFGVDFLGVISSVVFFVVKGVFSSVVFFVVDWVFSSVVFFLVDFLRVLMCSRVPDLSMRENNYDFVGFDSHDPATNRTGRTVHD